MAHLSPAAQQRRFALWQFYKIFMPSLRLRRHVSKESVYREQCVTNVGILHKPADSFPLSIQKRPLTTFDRRKRTLRFVAGAVAGPARYCYGYLAHEPNSKSSVVNPQPPGSAVWTAQPSA
jgi:hypothetical protein